MAFESIVAVKYPGALPAGRSIDVFVTDSSGRIHVATITVTKSVPYFRISVGR
jgi:hypothetical protein